MEKTSFKQKTGLVLLGIFASIVLIEILLTLSGMAYLSVQEYRNRKSIEKGNTFRILCLGESTTAFEDGHSYPRQLETILNSRNLGVQFSVINKGVPGIFTEGILARLNDNLTKYQPDMVITMMGINDPLVEEADHFVYLRSFKTYKLLSYIYRALLNKIQPSLLSSTVIEEGRSATPKEGNLIFLGVNAKSFEYLSLGENYLMQEEPEKAKEMFELSIKADPRNHEAYAALVGYYLSRKEYTRAEEICRQNMKNNPSNTEVYDDLAEIFYLQQKYGDAEKILWAALDVDPFYAKTYTQLSMYRRLQGKYDDAEKILQEGLLKMPKFFHGDIYTEMSVLYLTMGKFKEVESIHQKALEANPNNDHLYGMIGVYYLDSDDAKMAEKYFAKAEHIRELYSDPETALNYQKLSDILARAGIKHVAMQYAMRDIRPLKKMLGNGNDILFVDNGPLFRRAVKQGAYQEYFTDKFAGDFGHCTEKGDRLIAENVAQAIIDRYFKK